MAEAFFEHHHPQAAVPQHAAPPQPITSDAAPPSAMFLNEAPLYLLSRSIAQAVFEEPRADVHKDAVECISAQVETWLLDMLRHMSEICNHRLALAGVDNKPFVRVSEPKKQLDILQRLDEALVEREKERKKEKSRRLAKKGEAEMARYKQQVEADQAEQLKRSANTTALALFGESKGKRKQPEAAGMHSQLATGPAAASRAADGTELESAANEKKLDMRRPIRTAKRKVGLQDAACYFEQSPRFAKCRQLYVAQLKLLKPEK